jgi:predicted nucleic-acid-binding Zn-ribbon protein
LSGIRGREYRHRPATGIRSIDPGSAIESIDGSRRAAPTYHEAMRNTHRCPKCDHGEVLYVPEVRDSNYDRMALAGRYSLYSKWSASEQGGLEAYMCRECGYTEFYVREPASLDVTRLKGARILSATPRTPYR